MRQAKNQEPKREDPRERKKAKIKKEEKKQGPKQDDRRSACVDLPEERYLGGPYKIIFTPYSPYTPFFRNHFFISIL